MYELALQVLQMRNAQKEYFMLSAIARKTKVPSDFAASAKQLKVSKDLEDAVDQIIQVVINSVKC
jgi:hypothetical protein